jgi:hypothetical protein
MPAAEKEVRMAQSPREEYFAEDALDRRAAAELAVELSDQLNGFETRADHVYAWLRRRPSIVPARIVVGDPIVSEQGSPAVPVPLKRGANMAVVMTDTQQAAWPAPQAEDSKGFAVQDAITQTEDGGGAVIALTVNPDGSSVGVAIAPGTCNVTWTDGTISFTDAVNVTPGGVATIVVGAATVTDQAPAGP